MNAVRRSLLGRMCYDIWIAKGCISLGGIIVLLILPVALYEMGKAAGKGEGYRAAARDLRKPEQ